jgi:hypothetical protein
LRPLTMKSIPVFATLLLAAASPSRALTLSVLPAHPVEGTPFTLAVGLTGSCSAPDGIVVTPGNPGLVTVNITDFCLAPPIDELVEVPIGPLTAGAWILRVHAGGKQESLQVNVVSVLTIDVLPPNPLAGSLLTLRLTGNGSCPSLRPEVQDGNMLTLHYFEECVVTPLPPAPFVVEESIGPLSAGDFVVQAIDDEDRTLASHRFHVFGTFECRPSETALCLLNGRFRVEAAWRTATAHGAAHAHPETADSGALWFFGPDNLELLVKVLDACQTQSQTVWVFAAGLTDVEVEITVTEMATGRTRHYLNPLGRAFAPIQDTAAFSCLPLFPGS